MAFAAAFLAVTLLTGSLGDYAAYQAQWRVVLEGHDPWAVSHLPYNAYGPLFSALAPAMLISPLSIKLASAFAYVIFVNWISKTCSGERRLSNWFWLAYFFCNAFVWEQIAIYGYFDVLVGLSCVACLHLAAKKKDGLAGSVLALGILLKFMPIVILPFVAIERKRIRWRMVMTCVAVVAVGFLLSLAVWGVSTVKPLEFALTRPNAFSVYSLVNTDRSPIRQWLSVAHPEAFEKPLLLCGLLGALVWSWRARLSHSLAASLALLVTVLFYRESYPNYQMPLFLVIGYWAASEWSGDVTEPLLAIVLVVYFNAMTLVDLDFWLPSWGRALHWGPLLVGEFFLEALLLFGLIRSSARTAIAPAKARPNRWAAGV